MILFIKHLGPGTGVSVFDWGKEMFEAGSYGNDWNGTFNGGGCPEGVYYYAVHPGFPEQKEVAVPS